MIFTSLGNQSEEHYIAIGRSLPPPDINFNLTFD